MIGLPSKIPQNRWKSGFLRFVFKIIITLLVSINVDGDGWDHEK